MVAARTEGERNAMAFGLIHRKNSIDTTFFGQPITSWAVRAREARREAIAAYRLCMGWSRRWESPPAFFFS
ncbi:hypothetical protein F3Y22_tig00117034pilonHSYRG00488 [Hibiscus syriacus]|uniref:Uncharacterized protein n=1 Tax=Hibiscus syriacus TaxID=106335 RepID=A0A6A2XEM4_HIBSY|nr:hypothetical protein F3Y22_tig00117034pilonHSYRG00488 [Hibiscus syriacus]